MRWRGEVARGSPAGGTAARSVTLPVFEPLEQRELLTAQIPAFPGAEGYGMFTTGGRGGEVYEVTNLNDTGAGSLRDAVSQPNRTIVFRVSGNIELQSTLLIDQPNITIAGQTAPGDGITLKNYALRINDKNIIIRYLRVRPGDLGTDNQVDGISMGPAGGADLIFDHCSVSWAIDEDFSIYGLPNVTIQWCVISEALHNSKHPSGAHSMGGIMNGRDMTIHHSIFISNNDRNPKFNIADWWPGQNTDFRNNVIYNWGSRSTWGGNGGYTLTNMVNNYYKAGPSSSNPSRLLSMEAGNPGEWYLDGNYVYGYPSVTADNWTGVADASRGIRVNQPFSYAPVTTQSAQDAYASVLQYAGCTVPLRDSVDTRVLNDVVNGTGAIINSQTNVGGWPTLNSTTPPADTDHDGMPDSWEQAHGLNPNDPADRNGDFTGDGYTNLEKYLNGLVPTLGSLSGPVLPSQAFWPLPASSATQEDASPQLRWKAGFNTVSERVYFGTSATLTEADFKVEKVYTSQVINKQLITSCFYDTGQLQNGTTYYWRIDSVNANGVTAGQTWSFTPGPPVSGGAGKMEAENMTRSRANIENNSSASGGKLTSVPSETGTIRYGFTGATRIYRLEVRYVDEGDGAGTFKVYVNSDWVGEWAATVNTDAFVTRTFDNVAIAPGDVIKVMSSRHQDELGRVDYVQTTATGTDTTPPTSSVAALPPQVASPFTASWSGSDGGLLASLANYDIYVRDNGGEFVLWLDHTIATSAAYSGLAGHTYAFYSRARDKAGNLEAAPGSPDAQTTVAAAVAGRYVFYNRSYLDGNNPAANAADNGAIATDKQALLPGNQATVANCTSYSRGINGLMVDIAGLANPAGLSAADFVFKAGSVGEPGTWPIAPAPVNTIAADVRLGGGTGGSDRVTIIWADKDIQSEWLQVTVLANAHTGLAADDVFCFGNVPGDTNNDGCVDITDYQTLVSHFGTSGSISEGDFNVDGVVQFGDYQVLECHFGYVLPMLDLSSQAAGLLPVAMIPPSSIAPVQTASTQSEGDFRVDGMVPLGGYRVLERHFGWVLPMLDVPSPAPGLLPVADSPESPSEAAAMIPHNSVAPSQTESTQPLIGGALTLSPSSSSLSVSLAGRAAPPKPVSLAAPWRVAPDTPRPARQGKAGRDPLRLAGHRWGEGSSRRLFASSGRYTEDRGRGVDRTWLGNTGLGAPDDGVPIDLLSALEGWRGHA